ncbi:MAG: AMP-binding protein [Patescibacteria group bacterium]
MKIGYYPNKDVRNNVSAFVQNHAKECSQKIAFYYKLKAEENKNSLRCVNYGDFYEMVKAFPGNLAEMGIKKGDRIIVFSPISYELYVSIIGLQHMGAVPVLIDSISRIEQLKDVIGNSEPVGIIADSEWLKMIEDNKVIKESEWLNRKITIGQYKGKWKVFDFKEIKKNLTSEVVPVSGEDTALITYTTGSSGVPKGVDRTHNFLSAQHYALKRLFPYKRDDIDMPVFPVFALNNIASGISTVIPEADISRGDSKNLRAVLSQLEDCNVNCMTLSPSSFYNLALFCKENKKKLNRISRVLTGGAPISENEIRKFIEIVPNSQNWILYGSTEVEPISFIESREMISIRPKKHKNITQAGVNVGKIDKALSYKLIGLENRDKKSENLLRRVVKEGEVGELVVSGEHVCKKYYNNKEAFKKAKLIDTDGSIWHRTGDLARVESGVLWIVGRKHNIIRHEGNIYFPVRPEIILKDIKGVLNAAYLETEKHNILAVLVVENGFNKEKIEIKVFEKFLKKSIPLDLVVFMDQIPMDVRHHSKVDYKKLKQQLHESNL